MIHFTFADLAFGDLLMDEELEDKDEKPEDSDKEIEDDTDNVIAE